jgi:hypothetical protein
MNFCNTEYYDADSGAEAKYLPHVQDSFTKNR